MKKSEIEILEAANKILNREGMTSPAHSIPYHLSDHQTTMGNMYVNDIALLLSYYNANPNRVIDDTAAFTAIVALGDSDTIEAIEALLNNEEGWKEYIRDITEGIICKSFSNEKEYTQYVQQTNNQTKIEERRWLEPEECAKILEAERDTL